LPLEPGIRHGQPKAGRDSIGTKKPQQCLETAVRFLVHNLDALATLTAGIWATHVAWCRAGATTPDMEEFGRAERCIGPLLVGFAVLRFAMAP
jgi:hypothetical protein